MLIRPAQSVSVCLALLQATAVSPPARAQRAVDDEHAAARMEFMMQALGRYRATIGEDDVAIANLHPRAVLRWSNPVSTVVDGCLAVYTRGGRPDVVAELQLHKSGTVIHEFSPVAWDGLKLMRGERTVWQPEEGWIRWITLDDAPPPAAAAERRLIQMRRLAGRFRVFDEFGFRDDDTERYELRLMSRPVYRYEQDDVIDGALFVFAQGTNPEATLLIEAREEGSVRGWRYAFLPSTIYELEVFLDGEMTEPVWSKPRYKVFNSFAGPYHAGPYARDPDDISLEDALPGGGT